jgi:hypothetical protein
MSYFRHTLPLSVIGVALVWVGVSAQQTVPSPKPATSAPPTTPTPPPPPKPDPAALKSLEQAIELVDPTKRLGWIETKVWQQVDLQGLTFRADGRYLAGPGHRLRLDLKVHLGGTGGETSVVSDGTTVWQTMRAGPTDRVTTKWELKKVMDALNAPDMLPQLRDEFFRGQLFTGLAPLLQNLQKQMVFTQQAPERWNGHDVLKLTGVWAEEVTKSISPQPERWPSFLPRTCQVYLDSKTLWPYRFEWWGPAPPSSTDALLLQMEFREPVLHKAEEPMPKGFTNAFEFDSGTAPVTDHTKELTEQLKARNQQLAAQKRTMSPAGPGK